MKTYNIAIIGVTGLVGTTFLKVLEEKSYININKLYLFASAKSVNKKIIFREKEYFVEELNEKNIANKHIDFALFSAGANVSRQFAPLFKKYGAIVIDNSSAWRMYKKIPLVVPQVNPLACFKHKGIIANPNCSTIQCMAPLKALHNIFGLKKVNYTTYQAVSGSGVKGLKDLEISTKGEPCTFYPHPIFNNCLPHIDNFLPNGYTKEEMKMINESKKILGLPRLQVTATCVRVPIQNCHCIAIYAQFKYKLDLSTIYNALSHFPSIVLMDNPQQNVYPLPTIATGTDNVYVGRIRIDLNNPKALHIFCVADNVRKGAASNAIEIMELLINKK